MRNMLVTVSQSIADRLTLDEIREAFSVLFNKMRQPSPQQDFWEFEAAGHELWGILDEGFGPQGEDILSLLFPGDD
jgi:hypothetical protein